MMNEAVVDRPPVVNGLIDLNPTGRKQTKKRRPTIEFTENLRGWLEHWGEDRPLAYRAAFGVFRPPQARSVHNLHSANRRANV